jgi:hypothetical protein
VSIISAGGRRQEGKGEGRRREELIKTNIFIKIYK